MLTKKSQDTGMNKLYAPVAGSILMVTVGMLSNHAVTVNKNYCDTEYIIEQGKENASINKAFAWENGGIVATRFAYISNSEAMRGCDTVIDDDKQDNLKKLVQISELEDNWNGNGASGFSKELVSHVRSIITMLKIQPEVFPTAYNTLQLEYDKPNGDHMEIDIQSEKVAEVFEINSQGEEKLFSIEPNIAEITKLTEAFYG